MAAATAPQPRRPSAPPPVWLLFLLGAVLGSPFFVNTMCCLKKRAIRFQGEMRNVAPDTEAQKENTTSTPITEQTPVQILRAEEKTVPVFVLIASKRVILNCLSETLLTKRITDPKCQWTGPLGPITQETQRFLLMEDGSLEIYDIQGSDAGSYTCEVNYMYENKQMISKTNLMIYGSLHGVKVDHCKPGFGKKVCTLDNNTMCPGCCVTCPPGRFSAKYDTVCTPCAAGSYNDKYGQEACENCPQAQNSNEKGATTKSKCHRILPTWLVLLISSSATALVLVTIWVVITKCCKKTVAAQFIREAESEVKKRLQTFANIASDADIQEQRNKLSPIKVPRKKQPNHKVDFLEEEPPQVVRNDEGTEPSTPAGVSSSPDETGPSELDTSFEDESPSPLENSFTPTDLPPDHQKFFNLMKKQPLPLTD